MSSRSRMHDQSELLPDGLSLLSPGQRAELAARRSMGPSNAFEAILAATVPVDDDPPVPVVAKQRSGGPLMQEQASELLPAGLSLLNADQRADLAARRSQRS